jgi:hypothetical protein
MGEEGAFWLGMMTVLLSGFISGYCLARATEKS